MLAFKTWVDKNQTSPDKRSDRRLIPSYTLTDAADRFEPDARITKVHEMASGCHGTDQNRVPVKPTVGLALTGIARSDA